jgi:hypothetical protein
MLDKDRKDLWGREEDQNDDYEEGHDDRYVVGYRKPRATHNLRKVAREIREADLEPARVRRLF